MKRKSIETPNEMLGHIMEYLCECIDAEKESVIHTLAESTEFERGSYYGAIQALDDLRSHLLNLDKHGFEHILVEDWSVDE